MSNTKSNSAPNPAPSRGVGWLIAPVLIFAAITAMFALALSSGDPSKLPSALIGKPVPLTSFKPLENLRDGGREVPGFDAVTLGRLSKDGEQPSANTGASPTPRVSVVNFWSSWCVPCVHEHPHLVELQKRVDVNLFGVNYKDAPTAARRFLGRYGNPFSKVGVDPRGRGAIDWGVYGTPETFVIDARGIITYKHVGPISADSLEKELLPAIKAAQAATAPTTN